MADWGTWYPYVRKGWRLLANESSERISDDDARHEHDDDYPDRTVCCPFSSLVHLGVRNRSGVAPPAARDCP